jgi:hypothetical protein
VERALMPFEKKLPSTDIKFLVVTEKLVKDAEGTIKQLLNNPEDQFFAGKYNKKLKEDMAEIIYALKVGNLLNKDGQKFPVTQKRLEFIAKQVLFEDMEVEHAREIVLFWIKQVRNYEISLYNRSGIRIIFNEEAVDALVKGAVDSSFDLFDRCERICRILEHGLKLMKERTSRSVFEIPVEAIENTELFINKLIRSGYKKPIKEVIK